MNLIYEYAGTYRRSPITHLVHNCAYKTDTVSKNLWFYTSMYIVQ